MSKAVLIVEMPGRCMDCPLEFGVEGQIMANICRGYEKYRFNPDHSKKPDWCPLREVPEKIEIDRMRQEAIENDCYDISNGIDEAYIQGKCVGWNTCISSIEGSNAG